MRRPCRRRPATALALAALVLAGSATAGLAQEAEPWARIEGARIAVQPGSTVEVCGTGHLAFVDGRRTIEAPPGAAVRIPGGTDEPVRGDVAIEIRGPGESRWIVRRSPGLPAPGGTTIRDPEGGGPASIYAAEPTRFWLAVGEGDETVFFQAEDDSAGCDPAAAAVGLGEESPAAAIERTLDRLADYGFSGAVLVARADGETILSAGYGLADRERKIPVRPGTLFELGSLTKQFTAAAVLRLAERGLLSVEDTLGDTWSLPEPLAGISLHQLLTHTSGLPEDFSRAPSTREAVVDLLRTIETERPPGGDPRYSNLGYVLLAALLEEKTGTRYEDLLEELFFEPLGLERIGARSADAWPDSLLAVGYSGTFGSGQALDPHPVDPTGWDLLGASGVVGNLPDLHRWIRALRDGRVLSDPSLRLMFTPHAGEFGYGWLIYETGRGTAGIIHGGDTDGVQSYAAIFPDEDLVVLLAVNDRRGWRGPVFDAVVALALGRETPPLPPPTVPATLVDRRRWNGSYELPDGSRIEVRPTEDGLLLGAEGQSAVSLVTSPSAEERAELAARNATATAFMAALAAGDSAAVRAALAPSGRPESFGVVWGALTEGHAALERYEILGTAPDRAGREITFVRLHFPEGEETLRLVWRPHLDGWGTGGERPRREFFPVGPSEYAAYDLLGARTIRIRFHDDGGSRSIQFEDTPDAPLATVR